MKLPKWLLGLVAFFKSFVESTKAGITTKGAASLAIAFTVAAIVIPIGIGEIYSANTTGWNTAVTTIFTVLFPILFVVAIAIKTFGD